MREQAIARREVADVHRPAARGVTKSLLDKPVEAPRRVREAEPERREARRPHEREGTRDRHADKPRDIDKPKQAVKKEVRQDNRPHCKARPKENKPTGRGGGGKKFAPWCR